MTEPAQMPTVILERRGHPRVSVRIPVRIFVLVEEITFSPFQYDGYMINISRSGALAIIQDVSREEYARMIQKRRYVRVSCRFPGTDQPVMLFGKLIWYDFQEEPTGSVFRLALTFEPMKDEVYEALDRYLELQKKESGVRLPPTAGMDRA
ncbi:MAG: PilZ domain-containing protein [Candidatus Sumerlaeia bacterium]|nr:PilZ domain-containing protein [Candidatus Sumerlaeia bacterium]